MSADPRGWNRARLDDLGVVSRGRSRHRPRNDPSLYGGPYPFIQTSDIKSADLYLRRFGQTYNEKGLEQSKLWEPGTLCITIAANIAETAILGIAACFPDSVVGFTANPKKSDVRFVKYSIDFLKLQMQNISRGTTQDNLSVEKLLSFDFLVPLPPIQRKIASILSAYDDLIENNLRRIRILEEMAQALYREWFVEFRFPGHKQVRFVDSPLGRTPEGWEVRPLASLVDFAKGRKPPTTRKVPLQGDVRLLLIDSLRGGEAEFTSPAKLVLAGTRDTIMVMDGGSSCAVAIGFAGGVGSTLGRFRTTRNDCFSPHTLYRFLEARIEEFKSKNIGAAIPHANKDYILTQSVALPPKALASSFHNQLEPIQGAIEKFKAQIQNLGRTRDLLLPRLISGELNVADLDIAVREDAA